MRGTSLRPSVSELFDGRVKVMYSAPSLSSGRNSLPSRGSTIAAPARSTETEPISSAGRRRQKRSAGS